MSEPYIGQIYLVGYSFAQRGFALCQGQLLPISQNSALFSLLGTMYGGDGRTTFGLPDLQGRCALGQGRGAGLSDRRTGSKGGSETNTMSVLQMPSHNHTPVLHAETGASTSDQPQGNMLGFANIYIPPGAAPDRAMAGESIVSQNQGGGQSMNNMQPFLVLNYEIALVGVFPSRT